MKRILLILLSINLFAFAFGQSITVKGKVSSTDGELLPGVNVKVKDATIGTITDFDGNYQLKVNKGLSVGIHASVNGLVSEVNEKYVVIETQEGRADNE